MVTEAYSVELLSHSSSDLSSTLTSGAENVEFAPSPCVLQLLPTSQECVVW